MNFVVSLLWWILDFVCETALAWVSGWYPELVFISVVFSNSTNLAAVILNSSVLKIYFVK